MIIDDKLLVRNDYASRIPPARKGLQRIQAAGRPDPKRPIMPQHEGKGQNPEQPSQQRVATPNETKDNPKQELQQRTPMSPEEETVTMSLERYIALTQELQHLRDLEAIIQQACAFSVVDVSRQQINYKATIHEEHLTTLLHHMLIPAAGHHHPTLSPMEAPVRECAVIEIESKQ